MKRLQKAHPPFLIVALLASCSDGEAPAPSEQLGAQPANADASGNTAGTGDGDASKNDEGRTAVDDDAVWQPPDAGTREEPDLSGVDPKARMCATLLADLETRTDPHCTAETGLCVVACQGADDHDVCRDACAASDTFDNSDDLDCGGCITTRLLGCFADRGCSTNPLYCCVDDKCGGVGGPDGCVDDMCQPELMGLFACVTSSDQALGCLEFRGGAGSTCFADRGSDAGV